MHLASLACQTPCSYALSMAVPVESCRPVRARSVLHMMVCQRGLYSGYLNLGATLIGICLQGMSPEEINEYMAKHGSMQSAS